MIEDRELYRLAGRLGERVDLRLRLGHHVHLAAHERAELEEREARPVLAGLAVLLEEIVFDERRREAVHGALREPEAQRQRADAHLVFALGERLRQPDRVGDRRQADPARLQLVHGRASERRIA